MTLVSADLKIDRGAARLTLPNAVAIVCHRAEHAAQNRPKESNNGRVGFHARIEMMESNEHDYRNFQRHVDRLCFLIVATDCSEREIDIEKLHLRVQAMHLFPDKIPLYEQVYESRFRRLREQFRQCSGMSGRENRSSPLEPTS